MVVLLDDGRICRIGYTEKPPALPSLASIPAPSTSSKEKRCVCYLFQLVASLNVVMCLVVMMMEHLHQVPDH